VVCLSLKLVKTKGQLMEFFFENTYNESNRKHQIGFAEKIIVIEDIDAQGDIVLDRNGSFEKRKEWSNMMMAMAMAQKHKEKEEGEEGDKKKRLQNLQSCWGKKEEIDEDPITLDDILNLWDGIEENTGRILVISSNHYDKLDPALVRPGRIDLSIEMKKVSHTVLCQLYRHFYEEEPDMEKIMAIPEYFYSPAEVTNTYFMYKESPDKFLFHLHEKL